jgi:hypothetical protein
VSCRSFETPNPLTTADLNINIARDVALVVRCAEQDCCKLKRLTTKALRLRRIVMMCGRSAIFTGHRYPKPLIAVANATGSRSSRTGIFGSHLASEALNVTERVYAYYTGQIAGFRVLCITTWIPEARAGTSREPFRRSPGAPPPWTLIFRRPGPNHHPRPGNAL